MLRWLRSRHKQANQEPEPQVEIYTWRTCPFCLRAKWLLWRRGIRYREYRIGGDTEARRRMAERANGHWTVPEVFIDDVHVGGCEELLALARDGRLDDWLAPTR